MNTSKAHWKLFVEQPGTISFINADNATSLSGVEAEVRKSLSELSQNRFLQKSELCQQALYLQPNQPAGFCAFGTVNKYRTGTLAAPADKKVQNQSPI